MSLESRGKRILAGSTLLGDAKCLLLLAAAALFGCTGLNSGCGQKLESSPGHYCGYDRAEFSRIDYTSRYLTMRDGVRIAVDLYLPHGLKPEQRIPTILELTRYYRRLELRVPFRWLAPNFVLMPRHARLFVTHGYAWVKVDVRGTGASFGSVPYPFSPDEIKDDNEIVNWIVKQPWSNGKVGATGLSYDGDAAEFLLANENPAVKAIAPYFTFWDTYNDTAFPGGAYLGFFIHGWSHLDDMLDHAKLAGFGRFKWYLPYLVKGVQPVHGDEDHAMLRQAIAEHNNIDVAQYLDCVVYRDDMPSETIGVLDGFSAADRKQVRLMDNAHLGVPGLSSPDSYKERIEASGAAIYGYDAWYDAAYARGAIARFLTLTNPHKLILGPWIHGHSTSVLSGNPFDEGPELLRFFDYWLKGIPNGLMTEPPITYYTMVEESWKTAWTWPLPNQKLVSYYLGPNHSLVLSPEETGRGVDSYRVDYSATTGRRSRWEPLLGDEASGGSSLMDYGDRRQQDRKLLTYDSGRLKADTEVTGEPVVTLYVISTASDGYFFAYLEDIATDGTVSYVTEGELRALHRKVVEQAPGLPPGVPQHSFMRRDRSPMEPGRVQELRFDLLPISYLFKAGHSIRLAFAGADRDHFPIFGGKPPTVRFERDAAHASRLDLPIIPRETVAR